MFVSNTRAAVLLFVTGLVSTVFAQQDTPVPFPCVSKDFCAKHWSYEQGHLVQAKTEGVSYHIDPNSVLINGERVSATMYREENPDSITLAPEVILTMDLYQNGILRVLINEPESDRFRISQQGISVMDDQLIGFDKLADYAEFRENGLMIKDVPSDDSREEYSFEIQYKPFQIIQTVNDVVTMVVNPKDTLWVEHGDASFTPEQMEEKKDSEGNSVWPNLDYERSISLGFFYNSKYMFGLPGREYSFRLTNTDEWTGPYRLWNRDLNPHGTNNMTNLYGSAPYLTSHETDNDASVVWMNSADTFVDIYDAQFQDIDGTLATFVSEAGALEFFIMGSAIHPQRVQKSLGDITGFTALPPIHTLGFHFSKWAPVSADMVIERSQNFTRYGFPVDMLWMDIEHAEDYKWFEFNHKNFTAEAIERLKQEAIESERRLNTIIDPHIKVADDYFVYNDGLELTLADQPEGNITNVFMRDPHDKVFYGEAWPGNSTWVDFLNVNAQRFWSHQFTKFEGTNYLFSAWNDVNDPCVFNGPLKSMPVTNVHIMADGTHVMHRDVHNAYGTLEHRSSYRGILERDNHKYRPFILTRSFFLGSQKYGPSWTGDTQAIYGELSGSLNEMLTLGVAGMPFGGADIPGYEYTPPDDLFIEMYQLGMFYPFFRAHDEILSEEREPWLQSLRVQDVIRKTCFLRYTLISYIYNTFKQASVEAEPIIRAMWHEFPQDKNSLDLQTQFMFGDALLVAPKLNRPTLVLDYEQEHAQKIDAYLPSSENWYYWYSGALHKGREQFSRVLPDDEQGIYVRGGKILPILMHKNELSLLKAIKNDFMLKIYLDKEGEAMGNLYLDDGETFDYQKKDGSLSVEYVYQNDRLMVAKTTDSSYPAAKSKMIKQVEIVGFNSEKMPSAIYNSITGLTVEFHFDEAKNALVLKNVDLLIETNEQISSLLQFDYSNGDQITQ